MIFLFENFAESRLEGGCLAADPTLIIAASDAAKFPHPSLTTHRFALVLFDGIQAPEICWASTNSGSGVLQVERGQEGTTARAWRPGTAVINAPTKVSLNYLASGGADSWHQELVDMVNDAYARISDETTLRLDADGAFAERIQTVEAGFAGNNSSVELLSQAFADLSTAWAQYRVTVNSATATANANATQAMNTSAGNGTAIASLETFVTAAVGNNAAAFHERIEAFADFNEAQTTINTSLTARVGAAESAITTETSVRSTQYATQTSINTTQSSAIGANTAAISTESSTRASETGALATRSSNLEVEIAAARGSYGTLSGRINYVESVAGGDTGLVVTRVETLEAQMAGTNGSYLRSAITTEESARVSGDATQAGRTDTIVSQLAGTTGSNLLSRITTEESTRAGADGALASRNDALEAQMAGSLGSFLNSRIATEESVRSTAVATQAGRIDTLTSRFEDTAPNLLPNPNLSMGVDGKDGWYSQDGLPWGIGDDAQVGRYANMPAAGGPNYIVSDNFFSFPGQVLSISCDGEGENNTVGAQDVAYIQWVPSYTTGASLNFTPRSWNARHFSANSTPAPAGTTAWRAVFQRGGAGYLNWARAKVNIGPTPTAWSNEKELAQASASIRTESVTRAAADGALATRTSTVESQLNTSTGSPLLSRVQTTESTIANAGGLDAWWQVQAIAGSALAGIQARAHSTGGSQIGMIADAIALFNNVLGVAQEVLVASGGNVFIKNKLTLGALGQLELDPAYPAIIWTMGAAKLFVGAHPNAGLVLWFGPSMAVGSMTKANGRVWLDNVGNAFFGGSIIAGTLSNSRQGTSIAVGADTIVGPFATNGNPIAVVWSYTYSRFTRGTGNRSYSGTSSAQVKLYRTVEGSSEALIDTMNLTGNITNDYDGGENWTDLTQQISGSSTYTDTAGTTAMRTYRIEVAARSDASISAGSVIFDNRQQRYGITTSEN